MKKTIAYVLSVILIIISVFPFNAYAETVIGRGVTISETKMYSNAGTDGHTVNKEESVLIKTVPNNTSFEVYGSKYDGDGDLWYRVKLLNNDNTVGYLYSGRVKLEQIRLYDSDFEKNLNNFPAEYKEALRALHKEYPNWRFFAEKTNCTFESALEAEYRSGDDNRPRKFVELTYMGEEYRDSRAKKGDGTYENAEGNGRWTYASKFAISHFLNPTNFLNKDNIFMFLQLSYNSENQTKETLASVVNGTFLNTDSYLTAIMNAAKESGMSPYAIASLIIIEQGTKGESNLISGKYTGYEHYYNFFNVNASGETTEEIVTSGLAYAKSQGWDTIEKSITGGAKFSSNNYITAGQDTYYYMDYNIVLGNYNHQYATAIYDAYNKGNRLSKGLIQNKNATLDFVIPVFSTTAKDYTESSNITPTVTVKYGDINRDNTIDVIDAALMRKHILNISALNVTKNPEADINKDGKIDVIDAAKIRKHILGIEKIGG